jgi:hypothetical protein
MILYLSWKQKSGTGKKSGIDTVSSAFDRAKIGIFVEKFLQKR